MLAASIIEDLQSTIAMKVLKPKSEQAQLCGAVLFFNFDEQRLQTRSVDDALRSMLAQALHENHDDTELIDLVSMVMYHTGSGQNKATRNELLEILHIFLIRFGPCYIILDGLDECDEWEELICSVQEIIQHSSSKVVFLTRPHVPITTIFTEGFRHIQLHPSGNLKDIKTFLETKIRPLVARNAIPSSLSTEKIVLELSRQANGMFLWAVLMVNYLSMNILTPTDRLEAITNVVSFQGLDALISKILLHIKARTPPRQLSKVVNMFHWLAVLEEPWTARALQVALSVQGNRSSSPDDIITDFESILPQLSGSLVEVRHDETVGFIHMSVLELLMDLENRASNKDDIRLFSVNVALSHCSLAAMCLSYLLYDTEHQPLSGDASVVADTNDVTRRLPLLPYAVAYWTRHANSSINPTGFFIDPTYQDLFTAVKMFVSNDRLISTWIEASWLFGITSSLDGLNLRMELVSNAVLQPRTKMLELIETLDALSLNLEQLETQWAHVLRVDPNEIWLPSIRCLCKSRFWPSMEETEIRTIGFGSEAGAILMASQVSTTAPKVGIVKVWPPSYVLLFRRSGDVADSSRWINGAGTSFPNQERGVLAPCESSPEWRVTYQIWSLEDNSQLVATDFSISHDQLYDDVAQRCDDMGRDELKFRFPVTISNSLDTAVVFRTVLRLNAGDSLHSLLTTQNIPGSICPFDVPFNEDAHTFNAPKYFPRSFAAGSNIQLQPGYSNSYSNCYSWYQSYISPDARYLVVLEGCGTPGSGLRSFLGKWILSVCENTSHRSEQLAFRLQANVSLRIHELFSGPIFCFHPFKPVLAISLIRTTVLWEFTEGKQKILLFSIK